MSKVTVTIDATAGMFAIASLRQDAEWHEERRAFMAMLRGTGEPADGEVVDAIVGKYLRDVADALDAAVYPVKVGPPTEFCDCLDPICPKAHTADAAHQFAVDHPSDADRLAVQ